MTMCREHDSLWQREESVCRMFSPRHHRHPRGQTVRFPLRNWRYFCLSLHRSGVLQVERIGQSDGTRLRGSIWNSPGMTVPRKASPEKGMTGGIGLIAPLLKRQSNGQQSQSHVQG